MWLGVGANRIRVRLSSKHSGKASDGTSGDAFTRLPLDQQSIVVRTCIRACARIAVSMIIPPHLVQSHRVERDNYRARSALQKNMWFGGSCHVIHSVPMYILSAV